MKINRIWSIMVVMLFAAVAFSAFAAAEDSYVIEKVQVDGVEIDGDKVRVGLGDSVNIMVTVRLAGNITTTREAKIKAWLYGTEHDSDVESITGVFDMRPGVVYPKSLLLEMPADMDAGTYTLHVRIYDSLETVERTFTLYVEKPRHLVELKDFDVNPSTSLNAGDKAEVTVRLHNAGARSEEITVSADVPSLNIARRTWVDLSSGETETSNEMEISIPKTAKTGAYDLILRLTYNDGTKFAERKITLNVHGVEVEKKEELTQEATQPVQTEQLKETALPKELPLSKALLVSMDSTSQTASRSKEIAFKVSIASFDSVSRLITFKVTGAQLFADVRIDPSFVQLAGGQKGEAFVYAKLKADAEDGAHQFTLQVTADGKLVQEIPLTLSAEEQKQQSDLIGTMLDGNGLKIAFVVLVVFLIIIGLLVAFKRVRSDDYPLEPHDDRTYY